METAGEGEPQHHEKFPSLCLNRQSAVYHATQGERRMQIKATMKPGQNGTKQYLREYGDQLVCVRYRYDKHRQKRLTTVELIVNEQDWVPGVMFPQDRQVFVRIDYGERELREKVKQAGGYWDAERKAWRLSLNRVLSMGMERRIVDEWVDH